MTELNNGLKPTKISGYIPEASLEDWYNNLKSFLKNTLHSKYPGGES